METADVVIIGAGVIGLSIAYHLALSDSSLKIIVVEREKFPGMGSTAQCMGNISHQFPSQINIEMTRVSLPYFKRFNAEMRYPIYLRQRGGLFLTTSPERLAEFKKTISLLNELGIPAALLSPAEIKKRHPFIHIGDLAGGVFCALDSYADPHGVIQGYFNQARKRDVAVSTSEPVLAIQTASGRVESVQTEKRCIAAGIVIDAAGPHFAEVAAMAGVNLPARPYQSQVYVCEPVPAIDPGIPMIVDIDTGFFIHAEKSGTLISGGTDLNNFPGFDTAVDRSLLDDFIEAAVRRAPLMQTTGLMRIYVGISCLTPDYHGILGEVETIKGFYCAGGFGSHGFMHAPAVGLIAAQLICKGYTSLVNISPLSPNRFTKTATF